VFDLLAADPRVRPESEPIADMCKLLPHSGGSTQWLVHRFRTESINYRRERPASTNPEPQFQVSPAVTDAERVLAGQKPWTSDDVLGLKVVSDPQVSPDGKWLAYQSTETGRPEIYVKPFPEGPGKWQVSTDGGQFPRWRGDGMELFFYINNNLIAAAVRASGSSFEADVPKTLFGLGAPGAAVTHSPYHRFDVSGDGQRFLISQQGEGGPVAGGGLSDTVLGLLEGVAGSGTTTPNSVTVVLNWTRMLK